MSMCGPWQVITQVGIAWQKRIVKVSKSGVCFGKVGSDALIDYVPLLEIERVVGGKTGGSCFRWCLCLVALPSMPLSFAPSCLRPRTV
jgi:hypothetical protein